MTTPADAPAASFVFVKRYSLMKPGLMVKAWTAFALAVFLVPAMASSHEHAMTKAAATAKAAMAMTAKAATATKHHEMTTKKLGKQEAMAVQKALIAKGYKITADGKWGKKSSKALKEFQKKNNLKPTGHPDGKTLEALGVEPESR